VTDLGTRVARTVGWLLLFGFLLLPVGLTLAVLFA
jgi:hypothetical protein